MLVNKRIFQFGIFFVLMTFLALSTHSVLAAPIDKFPVTVTQPDGTELHLFASGDEFYNWLQDAQGFTVIQDPLTGYYVYADLVKAKLIPTQFIVGQTDPAVMGLRPYTNISPAQMENIRQASPLRTGAQLADTFENAPQTPSEQNSDRFPDLARKGIEVPDTALQIAPNQGSGIPADQTGREALRTIGNAPLSGVINNLVVFIRFSDESEFTNTTSTYTGMLNNSTAGANSLRNYFQEVSYNALTINSILYPTPGSIVVSYQDSHTRGYFQPYHPVTNLDGYTGGDNGTDRATREHTLLKDAINYVNSLGQFPDGASIDGDGDGIVDSLTFIVSGSPTGWSSLLWPHMWSLWSYPVTINGKNVGEYSFQLNDWLGNGVLAHEMFHVLGSPDLYHYSGDGMQPVGGWDVMEWNADPPQHMGCYMKFKYGGWINNIPELTTPGTYSLNPLTSSTNNCYKIASPYSATEFFVLEYRNGAGSTFESSLPGTGLLVYRINTLTTGNAGGPPDEVYIYAPDGTTSVNGSVNTANFSNNVGRTSINDATNPSSFLSDGSLGGLNICNVGASNATISFDICPSSVISISGNAGVAGAVLSYTDGAPKTATSNSIGFYTFVVSSGWSGTVTPSKAGMSFTPSSRSYTNVLASQIAQDYTALGGPDIFGYTWDDNVLFNWIDATGGTDTGLSGDGWGNATGLITLPFPFKYYENTYSQIYIAASGYLSFTNNYGYWPDQQSPMPSINTPNNVIAPFWTIINLANSGPTGRVYYKSGGAAPNRYFVVEWYDVKGGTALDSSGGDETYRFEVVLHESGDILFQYHTMTYFNWRYYASIGIEDIDGNGLGYMDWDSYWSRLPISSKAVRFYRPPASARVNLDPMQQGSFTVPGEAESYQINILNQGDLGSDIFDLNVSTTWPVTLYAANGVTLLTDTDSDGKVDSGSVPQGGTKTVIAKVAAPIGSILGDANSATITAVSSLNIGKSKTTTLQSAIPAPFAQIYEDDVNGAMSIELDQPDAQIVKKATADNYYGYGTAVTTVPNGNFVYVWSKWRNIGSATVYEIEYTLLDHAGNTVRAPGKLTNHSGAVVNTYDYYPSVAVAPNGTIGIAWYRYLYNYNTFQYNYNIYFATMDSAGNLTSGPTNLTNNVVWGSTSPRFYSPTIAASDDNRFMLSWEKYLGAPSYTNDIWYAVRNTAGGSVFSPTALTSNNISYAPVLNSLSGGKSILTWLDAGTPTYAVLNSSGIVSMPATVLVASNTYNEPADAVLLPNGKVAAAWVTSTGIQYAILNSSYILESGPFSADNPFPAYDYGLSLTTDPSSRVIMTWWDGGTTSKNLFYALGDSTGALITSPMIYKTSTYIESSYNGQGNAPLNTNVLSIVRASPNPTISDMSVEFTVTFSGSVTRVNATGPNNDFTLTTSPGITGAAIAGMFPVSGTTYTVRVNTGTGNGTIRLDVLDDNSIVDAASNPLGGAAIGDGDFTSGEVYTIKTAVETYIGGVLRGSYLLGAGESTRQNYVGVDSGPVKVVSTDGTQIVSAIREAWAVNGVTTSFFQMMGLPQEQLSDTYVFPGYNNVTLNEQLRISNVDTVPSTVTVTIGGVLRGTYPLAAGEAVRINYAGLDSGPVIVQGTSGVKIISAIREAWAVNGVTKSFVQLMGLPKQQLSDKYVFPGYNNVTLNEQLRIGNVDSVASTVTVTIGGVLRGTYILQPNEAVRVNYAGVDSGPVIVQGTAGVKIISAIREAWAVNGVTTSFAQLMGLPSGQLSNKYVFPGYNNVTLNDQLRIGNVDSVQTTVTVTIGGVLRGSYTLQPNEAVRVNYAGLDSGPVVVEGSVGVKIISAIREAWAVNGVTTSFTQLMGLPFEQLSSTFWFPAYNNVTLNEQIRIAVP